MNVPNLIPWEPRPAYLRNTPVSTRALHCSRLKDLAARDRILADLIARRQYSETIEILTLDFNFSHDRAVQLYSTVSEEFYRQKGLQTAGETARDMSIAFAARAFDPELPPTVQATFAAIAVKANENEIKALGARRRRKPIVTTVTEQQEERDARDVIVTMDAAEGQQSNGEAS